ncbi:hypothetical protein HMSSN036_57760 [Paenibacillus macerans]|nr:hypothetical protein HMSSN036_57760 [Paenibacillus macerans]
MKLLACVKANAYGHGAVPVAKELERIGADYLSVAFLDEALELRSAGIKLPILVLGYTPPHGVRTAWEHDITLNVFSDEVLEEIATLDPAEFPHKLKVHVKIDSGMGRLGLLPGRWGGCLRTQGHADSAGGSGGVVHPFRHGGRCGQKLYIGTVQPVSGSGNALREHEIEIPIIHTGNSAISIDLPELSLRMARIGIALYGLYPSDEVRKDEVQLTPVLSLKTRLVWVKTLPPHSAVSYGARYVTRREELIGTLPVGYADGYSRMLSGKRKY